METRLFDALKRFARTKVPKKIAAKLEDAIIGNKGDEEENDCLLVAL